MRAAAIPLEERPEARPFAPGRGAVLGALGGGILGLALLGVGLAMDPRQAAFSYLIAYAYVLAIVLGALALVMAFHATNATWPVALRRLPEAVMAALPLLALLFVPIAAGAGLLYPWERPHEVRGEEARHLLEEKLAFLNLPFALFRAAAAFAFWIVVAERLRAWSLRLDRPAAAPDTLLRRMRALSSGALPVFALAGTVVAWDWLMSLSPDWYSTMFGLYFLVGGFLTALAATALFTVSTRRAGLLREVGPDHLYALGRLLFAFVVFWAYCGYWQYFLSWIANRPIEAGWFVARTSGAYAPVAWFLVLGHFALPFFVLLSYWIKRRAWGLGVMAAWILAAHYFDVHWIVAAARERPRPFSWMDLPALLGVGGLVVAFALWRQRGHLLAPIHDPRFPAALEYQAR